MRRHLAVVVADTVGGGGVHEQFGRAEGDPEAFARQRVDVAGRITDQQHPPRGPAAHSLSQRAGGAVVAVFMAVDAVFEGRGMPRGVR